MKRSRCEKPYYMCSHPPDTQGKCPIDGPLISIVSDCIDDLLFEDPDPVIKECIDEVMEEPVPAIRHLKWMI